jgi:hypothetical protein
MNAGVTFAEQYHLTPGIALSAEQMAQLTSDIVWLVEQTVTLADGSTQRVLVPQVYVRVKPGDIDGSGALLSGSSVNLNLSGDLNNQGGIIAGRTTVALTADNIHNLGGRITGKDVALVAGTDLHNLGGIIDAQNSLAAIAGRNVNVITTTSDASSSATTRRGSIEQERTVIDRVAGLYVSDPGGSLAVYAGGNIQAAGAQIVSAGSVELNARGDVTLDSVTTGRSESIHWSSRNSRIDGSSSETGTTVSGGTNVAISAGGDLTARAATLSAGKDLSLEAGGQIVLYAGQNQTYAQTEYSQRSGMSYSRLEASSSDTTLARTTLDADNVKLRSGGDSTLGAIKVDANTLDIQAEGKLNLLTQTTSSSESRNESDGDAAFVNASTKGHIDETTNYNQFNVASVNLQASGGVNANVAKGTDLTTLAQQPGMAWVNQLISDPALVNSTSWKTVEEAHKKWQTDQSSLGPVSSAIVMLVVAVATVGAGTAAAGTAGTSATATAGATAGTGMAGAMGLTAGQTAILAGAMQAGITTLVGQATISAFNNGGNLAKVFDELGSSQSVKNLLTAMVTGGVLQGLDINPVTGQATENGGRQLFVDQLAQNVKGGVATALIRTAINGGSLEDALKDSLKSAFLNTIAAQTANEIGDLDGFMNKLAHAIAGCAVGAASAGNGGGCASGAIGAVIGELTAEAMGRRDDTVAVAALMAGLAAAVAGGDASQVNLAAGAGGNAAANNYLNHDQWAKFADDIASCKAKPTGCSSSEEQAIRAAYQDLSNRQNVALANCKATDNCAALVAQVAPGTRTMLDLVGGGQLPIGGAPGNDLGQYGGERLANDPAYRAQVNQSIAVLNACNANPSSCTQQAIKAAALVVFPLMGLAGVAITAEGAVIGGTIGAVANAGGQVYANHGDVSQINPVDVGMGALTGSMTYGATLWPSLFINTGGAVVTSAINNASPSGATGSIAGAAVGTAIGYPVGATIQSIANGVVNPWYRPLWQEMGLTIQRWIQPSVVPGVLGTAFGGIGQEGGNAFVNGQSMPAISERPTRGGQ